MEKGCDLLAADGNGYAGTQAHQSEKAAICRDVRREWHVDFCIGPGEARLGDADDGVFFVLKLDGPAEDVGLPIELLFPEEIADNDDRRRSGIIRSFGRSVVAAEEGWVAQEVEGIAGGLVDIHRDGKLAVGFKNRGGIESGGICDRGKATQIAQI